MHSGSGAAMAPILLAMPLSKPQITTPSFNNYNIHNKIEIPEYIPQYEQVIRTFSFNIWIFVKLLSNTIVHCIALSPLFYIVNYCKLL